VENGNMTTVYTMALYQEYEYSGGGFSNTGGSHMPVAITLFRIVLVFLFPFILSTLLTS
jgi:hypothetical protein